MLFHCQQKPPPTLFLYIGAHVVRVERRNGYQDLYQTHFARIYAPRTKTGVMAPPTAVTVTSPHTHTQLDELFY